MQSLDLKRRPWQRYLAEFIGTFGIVFAAGSAGITDATSNGAVTLLGQAFASGLMVAIMIYALGPVSAAHFNPAVTLAFATASCATSYCATARPTRNLRRRICSESNCKCFAPTLDS